MPAEAPSHTPVLVEEVLAALAPRKGGVYVDCTFGRGGHTRELLTRIGATGRVLALDRDPQAVAVGQALAMMDRRLTMRRSPFSALAAITQAEGVHGRVAGVLFDLGVSSPQLTDPQRGFGLVADGPLDMRMDPDHGESAAAWLRRASERAIAEILWTYGEERFARRVAKAIVRTRAKAAIETTGQLAAVVASACPMRRGRRHPATRTFQAIRIFINGELDELKAALEAVIDVLAIGGRLVVISFHSLEDRIVKRFIRQASYGGPVAPTGHNTVLARPRLRPIGKVVRPSAEEVSRNPRARSARLRVAEKCA